MHSMSNLMKVNNFLINEKINYEKMSMDELKQHEKKFKNMISNIKLINSLKDKGQRINESLKLIEEIISKKELTDALKETSVKKRPETVELEYLVDKLETLKVDKQTSEAKVDLEAEADLERATKENYFSKITQTSKKSKEKKEIDEKKLDEIKQKIKDKMNNLSKYKNSKEISVDEAFKLLKEHEKRIQEYQMKQAAERLIAGQSVKYEFSFIEKTDKKNLVYRETTKEYQFDGDEDYNEDDESENDDYYDGEEYFSGTGIDKVHKSERMKYKQYSDDLEKVD
ncbi:unnamed protein product [Brachionus calyciflorus]|uniref:Uncharacterized protein n=1 Tax=Brachionus calyciflorus TaxID=104777 RepID=A0A814GTH5_9BILA|nr:unnamed protein product [Brachionus calyciflorus]